MKTIKKLRLPHIYFGWWMLLMGSILSGLGTGIAGLGASLFFLPIATEFNLSRAAASVAVGTGSVANYVMFPLAGWLSDRFGPKWVIAGGVSLVGTGLILMNFINSAWSYYIVWGVIIGSGMGLGFTIAQDKILTNWFVKKRGMALGTRFAFVGAVQLMALMFISMLLTTQGWRITCLIFAGLIIGFGAFVVFRFVKQERPEYYGLLPDGAKVEPDPETSQNLMVSRGVEYAGSFQETEFTFKQATKTSSYWILVLGFMLNGIILSGFTLHSIPFLTDMGIDPIIAASMMGTMIFFSIPARFLSGLLADRVRKEHLKFLLAGSFLFKIVGILVFLVYPTKVTVIILLILFGLGDGYTSVDATIRARYFGRKSYGSIQGISMLFNLPTVFMSTVYTGWTYDVTGSYTVVFGLFAVIAAIGGLAVCLIRVPKIQEKTRNSKGPGLFLVI